MAQAGKPQDLRENAIPRSIVLIPGDGIGPEVTDAVRRVIDGAGVKLDWIVCSPAMHQVHHSAQVRHWDKNMGEVFAIWDWMFGTIYVPSRQREVHQLGTRDSEIGTANPHRTLWGFYWEPIRTMADMLRHPRLAYFSLQSTRHDEATLAADSAQYPSAAGLLPLPVGPGASAGATLHR